MDANDHDSTDLPAPPSGLPFALAPDDGPTVAEASPEPERSRRRGWWVAAAVVVVLALAGATVALATGGGNGPVVSAGVLTRAAAATQDAKSVRLGIDMAIEADGQSLDFTGDGLMTTVDGHPQLSVHLAMYPIGTMDERLIGEVLYLRLQSNDPKVNLAGGKWLKLDLAELAAAKPELRAAVEQLRGSAGSADPTSALDSLRGVSNDITEVGREKVKAGMATRYDGTLDAHRLADRVRAAAGSTASGSLDSMITAMGQVPISIWIDDEGRLVKYEMRLDAGALGGLSGKGSVRMSFEFYDFGVSAAVEVPPADQTIDGFDLLTGAKTS